MNTDPIDSGSPASPVFFVTMPPPPKPKRCNYCRVVADPRTNICQLCLRVVEIKEPEPWRR